MRLSRQCFSKTVYSSDRTAPAICEPISWDHLSNSGVYLISLREGRNRQIRRMMDELGHEVLSITRIEFGGIKVKNLIAGKWRKISNTEVV